MPGKQGLGQVRTTEQDLHMVLFSLAQLINVGAITPDEELENWIRRSLRLPLRTEATPPVREIPEPFEEDESGDSPLAGERSEFHLPGGHNQDTHGNGNGNRGLVQAFPKLRPLAKSITLEAPLDDRDVRQHLEDLSLLPESVQAQLRDANVKFVVGNRPVPELDEMGHLVGTRPRGWSQGRTWDEVGACYDVDSRQVILGRGEGDSASVALHETAHALDFGLDERSSEQDFMELWKIAAGLSTVHPYFKQDPPAGTQELFAEGMATHLKGTKPRSPGRTRTWLAGFDASLAARLALFFQTLQLGPPAD